MAKLRCGFLETAFMAAAMIAGVPVLSDAQNANTHLAAAQDKTLSFKIAQSVKPDGTIAYYDEQVHTITYYHNGTYDPKAFDEINKLLRDREKNMQSDQGMDKGLMDLLYEIKVREEARHPALNMVFHVISGYRSPTTNENLRTDQNNPYRSAVAKGSMHTHAKAIDIFVPEVSGEELRDTASCMRKGGVGWYPQFEDSSDKYIHIDTDRVRYWGFNPQTTRCP